MADVNNNIIWTLRDNVSAGVRKLNGELGKVGVQAKGTTGLMGKLSAATGGLVTPTSIAAAGAFALVGGLVAAGKAAIDEQKNIAKLDAALKANVAGYNGNRDSIERLIATREHLAFSDDDLRDSLALLVGATHDVAKAQEIQATAMDLARLKGISLQEASEGLIKVEAGSYRILKSLGIVLKDGATQQDALNAVQRVASGQAKEYAATVEGKLTVAQIKFNDAMEDLGARLLPIAAEAANTLVRALDPASISMDEMADAAKRGSESARLHLEALKATTKDLATTTTRATDGISSDIASVTPVARAMSRDSRTAFRLMAQSIDALRDTATKDASDLIDKFYDPIIARDELIANKAEIAAAKRVLASSTASAAEKADARATLHSVAKDNDEIRLELLSAGKLTAKEQKAWVADLRARMKESTGSSRRDIQLLINKILELGALDTSISIKTSVTRDEKRHQQQVRAQGGPVMAGETYTVGENGPETLVMGNQSGTVIPNGGTSQPTIHNVIYLDGKVLFESMDRQQYYALRRQAPTSASA